MKPVNMWHKTQYKSGTHIYSQGKGKINRGNKNIQIIYINTKETTHPCVHMCRHPRRRIYNPAILHGPKQDYKYTHLYKHICMQPYTHAHTHICTCTNMPTHTYWYLNIHIFICTNTYAHTYLYTCIHTLCYVPTCKRMYVPEHIHMSKHIHNHIHIHMHT